MSSFGPISSGPIHPSCSLPRPSSSPSKSSSLGSSSLRPLTGSSMTSPVSGYLRLVGSIPPTGVPRDKRHDFSALDGSVPPSSPSAFGGSIPPSSSLHSGGLRERHQVVSGFTALDGSIPPSSPSAVGGSIPPSFSLHSGGLRERHPVSSRSSALDGSIPPSLSLIHI